jgi:hypothetical protein
MLLFIGILQLLDMGTYFYQWQHGAANRDGGKRPITKLNETAARWFAFAESLIVCPPFALPLPPVGTSQLAYGVALTSSNTACAAEQAAPHKEGSRGE